MAPNHSNGLTADVAVVGGGIIGLAVALRARQHGLSVRLLERGAIGAAASRVAAGMLAPVAEVELSDSRRRALGLGLRSAQMWPELAAELEELTGIELGLRRAGTLMVARDADEARELERQLEFRESLGLRAVRLRASQAREREPALAPTVRLALVAPDDHSVDPRRVTAALHRACELAGVQIEERAPVAGPVLDAGGTRVEGVRLEDGSRRGAGEVVVAAGAWSARQAGLPEHLQVPVRPIKGQLMYLRDPEGPGLLAGAVRCPGAYLVPRADGRYALGATVEEREFDDRATAGGVYELLREAHELVPGISELVLEEVCVGFRPGTPDNVPIIGRAPGCRGLVWATGHHRNGILLTPLTGTLVAELLTGGCGSAEMLAICDPARFAGRPGRSGGNGSERPHSGAAAPARTVPARAGTTPGQAPEHAGEVGRRP